ncbi:MAG: DUF4910 domain-containing protein [Candidatus Thorarchaeota archaeon]|nr:MAG: DUF4910 domain-containing protein [Candidatus Thorarchaeota archaeon]
MLPEDIIDAVNDTVSGVRAQDLVNEISLFHRIQASPGILDAMKYLKSELEKASQAEVKIHKYKADGSSKIETWENLYGWEAKSATLALIEPEKETLADFQAEPISLAAHSTSCELEAEVVYVGGGLEDSDYEGKDIEGKIVLTEGRASLVHRIACLERNAAGVLTFVPPSGNDELANLRRYEGLWPRAGEAERTKFGFALTQADGIKLKKWVEEGKTIKAKVKVQAKLSNGSNPVMSALISGKKTAHEVWIAAHICHPHPGANDNASGSAAIAEALRVISRLIQDNMIDQPEYSIRFLWVPEWHGTIHYIHENSDELSRCKFMINADMVGADPCKSGSTLHLFRTPYSLPSSLNNVVRFWIESEATRKRERKDGGTYAPLPHDYKVYSAGSDHYMLTDGTVRIPAVMLNQFPDRFYHTSTDTSDHICPAQMAFVCRALVLSILTLANPQRVTKETLLATIGEEASELLGRVLRQGVDELARCRDDPEELYPRLLRRLTLARDVSLQTLEKAKTEWPLIAVQKSLLESVISSLEMEYTAKMVVARRAYEGACAEVGLEAKEDRMPEIPDKALNIEIKRMFEYALSSSFLVDNTPGGVTKYKKLRDDMSDIFDRVDEMLNLAVEWKNLGEIWEWICFQFGDMDSKILVDIVEDLKNAGLLESRNV